MVTLSHLVAAGADLLSDVTLKALAIGGSGSCESDVACAASDILEGSADPWRDNRQCKDRGSPRERAGSPRLELEVTQAGTVREVTEVVVGSSTCLPSS